MKYLKQFESYRRGKIRFYNNGKWFSSADGLSAVEVHKKQFGDDITFSIDGIEKEFSTVEEYRDYIKNQQIKDMPSSIFSKEEEIDAARKRVAEKRKKRLDESVINLSNVRKFPTYKETRDMDGEYSNSTDFYYIYKLSKKELGDYLNTWFRGVKTMASDLPTNKVKAKRGELTDYIVTDEVWTVKKTDKETSNNLYNKDYNPIGLSIQCKTGGYKEGEKEFLYNMIASIKSIDDSSFTIWFMDKPLDELESIRENLMKWINSKDVINGHKFMDYCIELGADEDQLDYN
jgi:hypothetical protein